MGKALRVAERKNYVFRLHSQNTSDTKWVEIFFNYLDNFPIVCHSPTVQAPTGCPAIPFRHKLPGVSAGPTGGDLSPTGRLPISGARDKSQVVTCTSDQLPINCEGSPNPSLGLIVCYNGSQSSRERLFTLTSL